MRMIAREKLNSSSSSSSSSWSVVGEYMSKGRFAVLLFCCVVRA